MKTKFNEVPIFYRKMIFISIMRAFIFFFSIFSMGFTTENSFSQNAKIRIDSDQLITVEQAFDYIRRQTDYTFIYKSDLFLDAPKIEVKKGTIRTDDLLKKCLAYDNFEYRFTKKGDILLENRPEIIKIQHVTGTVKDDTGTPLIGATVLIKGTARGTQTDVDGNFELDVADGEILVFSYLGFIKKEISYTGQSTIDVTLEEDSTVLDEIVVIGFGEKKKRDLTGSISTVKAEDIEKTNFASPQFALQGNTTGVRVINSSGDPNSPPEIYVRGIGSWQGNAQPLYVIDGQIITPPSSTGNLDVIGRSNDTPPPNLFTMINPDDIESITVLKDASSAAIYGSRGANGVVLITTKTGIKGKPVVEFNSRFGVRNIDSYDVLNTKEYRTIVNEMYANNLNPDITIENQLYGQTADNDVTRRVSYSPQFDPASPFYIGSDQTYDWQDELIKKNATTASYDFKVSGANDNTDYYISLGYDNHESNLKGNALKTYRAAINLNTEVTKWLKIGINYKFAYQQHDIEDQAGIDQIAGVSPWQPLYDPNNIYGYQEVIAPPAGDWQPARIFGQGSQNNYLALMDLNRTIFDNQRHLGQGYIEVTPIKGLTLRSSLNLDYTSQDRITTRTYRSNIYNVAGIDPAEDSPAAPNSLGFHDSRANFIYNYQYDFSANYEKSIGEHHFVLTAAVQDQFQRTQLKSLTGENLTNISNLKRISFSNDLGNNSSIADWNERFWFGYVGRLSYNYSDKYYVDASFRRDASSGMAKDYRWGNFYSLSGAWRLSSESFMKNIAFLSDFKLRGGYGEAGSDEAAVGKFAYLSTVGGPGSYSWGSGNGDALGIYNLASSLRSFPNETLVWEVAKTSYVGFDASLFNYKFDVTLELYNRTQDGIQQTVNLPLSVGTNDPIYNVGVLENRGVDLSLGYNNHIGDLTYNINTNISFLKNEVIDLYNDQPLYAQNEFQRTYRVEEGRSLGVIWGYKVGGIFQTQQEIDEYYANTPDATISNKDYVAPGDLSFLDVGGDPTEEEPFYSTTPDGQINTYDQTEIGNTIPGYTYGLNLSLEYKGFDLYLNFYGEGDVDKYNYARAGLEGMNGLSNFSRSTLNRWTPENTETSMPRAVIGDPANNNRFSDRFVESAAFFRLNNWQLGYSVPGSFLGKIGNPIRSIRFYVAGQNNIYITAWKGLDPVNNSFPLPRGYSIGFKVTF